MSKADDGMVAIKLDMEQAYDSMCWKTLHKMLGILGFPKQFMDLVMECIMEPRYAISINGGISNWIEGKSGFHQGCPLSPFLFIICSQLLSNGFFSEGQDHGIRIAPNTQRISHLLYAEDVLLFSDAKVKSIKKVKNILVDYCAWTGLSLNTQKSALIFNKSVNIRRRKKIVRLLEIKQVEEMEYLGTKFALRKLKKTDFKGLLDHEDT
ncbi:putative mitochondrial protein [Dendrobium catenatum]|uniref:Putative mitochondrial protein n=1 Tax=Dendrobium catenatum TaxID=906689 RepID=A0A2I0V9B8_9ASPA|nr:putative mitochondrial protein [Dendrobium catenatum]